MSSMAIVRTAALALVFVLTAANGDVFRPPMTPLVTYSPMHQIFIIGDAPNDAAHSTGKYWDGSPMGINVVLQLNSSSGELSSFQLVGEDLLSNGIPYANTSSSPTVDPLVTTLHFTLPSTARVSDVPIGVKLRFIHQKLPTRLDLVSRPVVYVEVEVTCVAACDAGSSATMYLDMNGYNAMHLLSDEIFTWDAGYMNTTAPRVYSRIGTEAQKVLGSYGDDFMLDWGFLYLTSPNDGSRTSATVANASLTRALFASSGTLPGVDTNKPRVISSGNLVASITTTFSLPSAPSASSRSHVTVAYDESAVQYYFGDVMLGEWRYSNLSSSSSTTTSLNSFEQLLAVAEIEYEEVRQAVFDFDASLIAKMTTTVGEHFAKIGSLAFRQAWAAIELSYSERYAEHWAFLKEISSDGDINTMDVIFPASPLFLWIAPEMVKRLLLPVLHYAINQTWHPYTYPFCPHQLGVYPVANITTIQQEIMPAENTGNMFLMLLGYCQKTEFMDTDWIFNDYWDILTKWAMYTVETQLPVPPFQICTDDFAGPLAQNTNLAIKNVIALEAYAELCDAFQAKYGQGKVIPPKEWNCHVFHDLATSYAEFWSSFAVELDPVLQLNHSRLAFDQPNTWSTKYNMLWQRLLGLQRPFVNFDTLASDEVKYYKAKSNAYGFPMDIRHTYQKLDWMTWGSCLSKNVTEFAEMFEGIYAMADSTTSRWALTDLFDTVSADIVLLFRSRPVVGAVFAAMMLY